MKFLKNDLNNWLILQYLKAILKDMHFKIYRIIIQVRMKDNFILLFIKTFRRYYAQKNF